MLPTFAAWAKAGYVRMMSEPLIESEAIELQSFAPSRNQIRHGWKKQ
jgi:hypothetical protein